MVAKNSDSVVAQKTGSKRRRFRRHKRAALLWYRSIDIGVGRTFEGVSFCFNISRGGLGLVLGQTIPANTLLFIEMTFEQERREFSAVGRVVYTKQLDEGRYEMGFEFITLPPSTIHFLGNRLT